MAATAGDGGAAAGGAGAATPRGDAKASRNAMAHAVGSRVERGRRLGASKNTRQALLQKIDAVTFTYLKNLG